MNPLLQIALLALLALMPTGSRADLASTAPSEGTIREATATCTRTSAQVPSGLLGISDPHASEAEVISIIADAGVTWVRAEFHWSQIEPVAGGGYRWGPYDRMVRAYRARGIRVQAILTYIPDSQPRDWARIADAFHKFTAAAVARYAPMGVHHWEVFNEPNLPGYGWLSRDQSAQSNLGGYTLLLARANQAVRANDPSGVVLIGGIASDQHRGLPLERTMQIIYGLGARNCFDVMAYHPYGYQGMFPQARARVDAVLVENQDTGKPVWFNEYGWTDQTAMDMSVNPTVSTNPMLRALSQRASADALFWFSAKDYSGRSGTPTFGLANFDGQRRPSFETLRAFITAIR